MGSVCSIHRLQPQQFRDSSDLLNVLETTTYDIEPDAIVLAIRPYELHHSFRRYRTS